MKSSSFAITAITAVLGAACLNNAQPAFGWPQGTADSKACASDSASCFGQVTAPASNSASPTQPTPSDAEKLYLNILAEFSGGLNVKKLKPGDKIKAEVSQDVLWHGRIIIPEES